MTNFIFTEQQEKRNAETKDKKHVRYNETSVTNKQATVVAVEETIGMSLQSWSCRYEAGVKVLRRRAAEVIDMLRHYPASGKCGGKMSFDSATKVALLRSAKARIDSIIVLTSDERVCGKSEDHLLICRRAY